jgi:hypothetical protein
VNKNLPAGNIATQYNPLTRFLVVRIFCIKVLQIVVETPLTPLALSEAISSDNIQIAAPVDPEPAPEAGSS